MPHTQLPAPGPRLPGYFGGCPVVRVPGFTHPVEDFYLENILQLTGGLGSCWWWEGRGCLFLLEGFNLVRTAVADGWVNGLVWWGVQACDGAPCS